MRRIGFSFFLILSVLGCGKKEAAVVAPAVADIAVGAVKSSFTQSQITNCSFDLGGSVTNGQSDGKSDNNRIELKNDEGFRVLVILAPFTYGSSRTHAFTVEQGFESSQVAFTSPTGSYSTSLAKASSPDGKCNVTIQYSGRAFQVACTNVAGLNGDKASMILSGNCAY